MTNFEPSIPEFYSGKTVFITGATGFLGKALIEKLLRSCPDIGDIYVLMRPKRGIDVQDRVRTLANNPIFERVKGEQPNLVIEKRVVALAGDCKQLNLGLSPEDRNILIEKVNVIFHVAASVRFDDPLSDAIIMNARGTREACQLALDAKSIMAFIHVSTTYVNSDRPESKEVIYPPKLDWKQSIEIAEKMNKNTLKIFTSKIIDKLPNTYTFTKHIAEHIVEDMLGGKIPCKIYRPSVVISAMREPVEGWIDNLNGPVGIVVAYGVGILRTSHNYAESSQDYIPIDVVTKSLIVCAWDLAVRSSSSKIVLPPEVMNASAYKTEGLRVNSAQWSIYCKETEDHVPLNDILWVSSAHYTSNWYYWYIRTIFTMVVPSIFIDLLLIVLGKETRLLKLQKRIFVAQTALAPIITKEYTFHNDNLLALQQRIQEKDKVTFDYDFQDFDLKKNMLPAKMCIRRYILNMPDSTIESAKRHYNRMWWIQKFVYTIFWMFIYALIAKYVYSYLFN